MDNFIIIDIIIDVDIVVDDVTDIVVDDVADVVDVVDVVVVDVFFVVVEWVFIGLDETANLLVCPMIEHPISDSIFLRFCEAVVDCSY